MEDAIAQLEHIKRWMKGLGLSEYQYEMICHAINHAITSLEVEE